MILGWYIEDGSTSYIQYVLGIFGPMKEEVNLLKNDSRCGGDVSDLSLYNSKVIWAANAGHLMGPVSQAQGERGR